jgi:ribosomal protein S18 acetylase RimI-like enzyme
MVDDARALRALRLEALENHPEAFASSLEEEQGLPEAHYADVALRNVMHGAFVGPRLAGMAGFYVEVRAKMRHRGAIWGVYVQPDQRGHGLGRGVVEAVSIHVATENQAARSLYLSLGFEPQGVDRGALRVAGRDVDEEHLVLRLGLKAPIQGARSGLSQGPGAV